MMFKCLVSANESGNPCFDTLKPVVIMIFVLPVKGRAEFNTVLCQPRCLWWVAFIPNTRHSDGRLSRGR